MIGAVTEDELNRDIYFMRRLREVRQAGRLTPKQKVILANDDNFDDDALEEAQSIAGGREYGKSGWGLSESLDEILSRESKTIEVADLSALQKNLKSQGYVHPDTPVDGVWSPLWSSGFRRFDRDNEELVRSGKHWLAAPVSTGVRTLSYTLPSRVFQAIVGFARGYVDQTAETAERVGLTGGLLAGAAIGTAIAPGLGTLIGGAAGGVTGFFSDLFGEDEGEDQDDTPDWVDALSPWEEYKAGGSKAFFEDLGWVLSTAMAIRGGAMAIGGARGGIAAAKAAGGGLQGALAKTVPAQPGLLARAAGAGVRRFSSSAADTWINVARHRGLLAQTSRPMLQTINGAYRGLASGSVGIRLSAGLGSGEEETTLERTISEEPLMPHAELIDNTVGLFVFSDKFLPIKPGGIAQGAKTALATPGRELVSASRAKDSIREMFAPPGAGRRINEYVESGLTLKPYIHVAQTRRPDGTVMSLAEAREASKRVLSGPGEFDPLKAAHTDTWLRTEYGLHRRAGEMLNDVPGIENDIAREKLFQDALANLKHDLRDEWARGEGTLTRDLLKYSHENPLDTADGPMSFAGFLQGLDGFGSSLHRMDTFRSANRRVAELMRDMDAGTLDVRVREGLEGFVEDTRRVFPDRPTNFDARKIRREVKAKNDEAKALEARAKKAMNYDEQEQLLARARELRGEAEEMVPLIKSTKRPKRKRPFSLAIARIEDPATGAAGYSTEQDILSFADEYERRAGEVSRAYDGWIESLTPQAEKAYKLAQEEMIQFSQRLYKRGLVSDADLSKMQTAHPNERVAERLRKRAQYHAKDVELPDEIREEFAQAGYKVIATRDDLLMFDELDKARQILEINGVGDYTRRAAFFETLGLSPWKHSDRSLFALRRGHEDAELNQVLHEAGIQMTGKQAMRKIHNYLNDHNKKHALIEIPEDRWGKVTQPLETIRQAVRYRVDVRELSPEDVAQALDLDGITPKTVELIDDVVKVSRKTDPYELSQRVYAALKRGAAMGADADFANPIDSARLLARALRVNGLPGFSDFMRTFHIPQGARAERIAQGAGMLLGGAVGAEAGGRIAGVPGAIAGAALGGFGGGVTGKKFTKGTYGYLPDHLHRLNMALRYTLSFTFDAGRYMEQNMLGMTKAELPIIMSPRKYIMRNFHDVDGMTGEEHWQEAIRLWDKINGFEKGKGMLRVIDDTDRRMFQVGMLGFSPRYHEAAQAYILHRRGWKPHQIEETISQIGRYGTGRAAAEKSVNFVFFPYSFQKKLVTTLGDFVLQAPGRNLLLHEGLRRFEQGSADEKLAEFVEKRLPFARQLARLNNLSYGLSPGRFFLEGVGDRSSNVGKAAQLLGSFFVPSGAATPVAQAFGGLGDAAVHFFVPTAVAGEEIDGLDDIIRQYVPLTRDLQAYWRSGAEQVTAFTEGAAPYYQLQQYLDERRARKARYEPMALAMGYASVDGFLQSDVGAGIKAELDQNDAELAQKYPTGFRMSNDFENTQNINKQALYDLADRPNKTPEEEDIIMLSEMAGMSSILTELTGLDSRIITPIVQRNVRKFAIERADNERFARLYKRFFEADWGPITRIAA